MRNDVTPLALATAIFQHLCVRFEFAHRNQPGIHIMNGEQMAELLAALKGPAVKTIVAKLNRREKELRRGPVRLERSARTVAEGSTAEAIGLGRDALGWSRQRLEKESGVSVLTILNIEKGRSMGRPETVKALRGAMERAGVVFTPEAVSWNPRQPEDVDAGSVIDPEAKPSEEEWIAEQEALRSEDDRPPVDGDAPFEPV